MPVSPRCLWHWSGKTVWGRCIPRGWPLPAAVGPPATPLSDWFQHGTAKVCVYVDSEEALLDLDRRAKEAGILSALICDAGMTEFHGQPTFTCLALEPLPPEQVDPPHRGAAPVLSALCPPRFQGGSTFSL